MGRIYHTQIIEVATAGTSMIMNLSCENSHDHRGPGCGRSTPPTRGDRSPLNAARLIGHRVDSRTMDAACLALSAG